MAELVPSNWRRAVADLSDRTEHEGAKASFKNGLLTVTLPKTERAKNGPKRAG